MQHVSRDVKEFRNVLRGVRRQIHGWSSLDFSESNARVNALVHTFEDTGVPQANGDLPLNDMSLAIKDNICTSSMPTTCSSEMLRAFTPPFDATVVSLLKQAGALIAGKANCDEFGMGSLNVHSVHGPVINPNGFSPSLKPGGPRSAGGSSGGSAAAVAAGLCRAALGTDTGGSVRLPASYCGIVGLKPSYGLISRWGVVSYSDSLDCVGVMARTVSDVNRVFNVLAVHDSKDPTAATSDARHKASVASRNRIDRWHYRAHTSLDGLRIGVPQEYFPSELDPSIVAPIRNILASLKSRGASLVPISLPSTSYALSAYYVIASAEANSNLARYDGVQYGLHVDPPPGSDRMKTANVYAHTRTRGFGHEVKKRILLGAYALTADAFDNYFLQAQRIRKLVRTDFDRVFTVPNVLSSSPRREDYGNCGREGVDVLIHPSAIRTAPLLSEAIESESSLDAYVQDVLTVPASLAGLPALSVPAGVGADAWPVGVSVVGQWGCDDMVLKVGEAIEHLMAERPHLKP